MSVKIREAQSDDIPWLIQELGKFSNFYQTKRPLLEDEQYASSVLTELMTKHFFRIAEKNDERLGFIGGMVLGHAFNPKIKTLTELCWWVEERFRGTRAGLMLINELVRWGKENCDWITVSLEANSPVNPDCLEKRGFNLRERNYLMEV